MGYEISYKEDPVIINYPVTLEEAKAQCRIEDDNSEDILIQSFIKAATEEAELFTQRDISKKRKVLYIWDFTGQYATIYEGGFNSIEGIVDTVDASLSYDTTETRGYWDKIEIKLSESVTTDPLTVQILTGYDSNKCPHVIRHAILMRVKDYYDEERDSYIQGNMKNTKAFERLLGPYRSTRF